MNGTEQNPRNNLYTWGNSLYITKQWGEMVGLRKLVTHVGERRKQTPTHPAIKTKDLNVKTSLQLWEENIGKYIYYHQEGKDHLYNIQTYKQPSKRDIFDYIKSKDYAQEKKTYKHNRKKL